MGLGASLGNLELDVDLSALPSASGSDLGIATTPTEKYDELVRELVVLEPHDLEALEEVGPARSQSGIQHIRAIHHAIALRLAAGEKPVQICRVLSVTPQTITKLQKDEQFQLLIESYQGKVTEKVIDSYELMGMVGNEALLALHEKLTDDDRAGIPLESLRRVVETMADRTGLSPIRRSESVTHQIHELSNAAIARIKTLHAEDNAYQAQSLPAGEIIETHQVESENQGAAPSISGAFESVAETEADGDEGGGEGV